MTRTVYVPSYFNMLSVIESLLRLTRDLVPSYHWTNVLSYQVQLRCKVPYCWGSCRSFEKHEPTWQPEHELKLMVDMGYANVDPNTGQVTTTDKFESLASQLLDAKETEEYPPQFPTFQLRPNMEQFPSGESNPSDWDYYTYRYFEKDDDDSIQLRSKVIQEAKEDSNWCRICGDQVAADNYCVYCDD